MLPFNVKFFLGYWPLMQHFEISKENSLVLYDKNFKNGFKIIKITFDCEPFIKKDSKKLMKNCCDFNNHIF